MSYHEAEVQRPQHSYNHAPNPTRPLYKCSVSTCCTAACNSVGTLHS